MNEYLVAFDISDTDYYKEASDEFLANPLTKDYGLSYVNLVQLYDLDAVITSVNLNPLDEIPGGALEQVVDIVHHGLIFGNKENIGESLAEILPNYYYSYTVTFESHVPHDRIESVADKYGLPVPVLVEEL